ncbi:MAG: hypothetical protein JW885_05210 [Deltaproteobacteria bacterium]|nr:hypothetical protein [Candidatus Zymogenaceae bacterium]
MMRADDVRSGRYRKAAYRKEIIVIDDLTGEKKEGFDFAYLGDVPRKEEVVGDRYKPPGFGLAAQLFSATAKVVMEKLGREEGRRC